MPKKIFVSLPIKIISFVILIIFVFGSIATFLVFSRVESMLTEEKKGLLINSLYHHTNEINLFIQNITNVGEVLSTNPTLIDYLENPSSVEDSVVYDLLARRQPIYNFSAVYLLNTNGDTLVSTDERFLNQNYSFRSYFMEAMSGVPSFKANVGVTSNELGYYFATPIKNLTSKKVVGILVFKINPNDVRSLIEYHVIKGSPSLDFVKNANFLLIDNHGVVIGSKFPSDMYKSIGELSPEDILDIDNNKTYGNISVSPLYLSEFVDTLKNASEDNIITSSFYNTHTNSNNIVAVSKIAGQNFKLIYIIDSKIIDNYSREVGIIVGLVVLISAASSGIILSLIISKFLSPIKYLINQANDFITKGTLPDLSLKTGNELEQLSISFNEMVKKILNSKNEAEAKIEIRTQELLSQQKALVNVLEDVEREKSLAESRQLELQKFQLAVDNAFDHIVMTDEDGNIIYANKGVERITGFKKEEVLGKKAGSKELWGGLMSLDFYKTLWKAIKVDKIPFSGEVQNKRKSGELYTANASITPVLDKEGTILFFIGIERDITKEREIDKMKTEFISLASHQLRTPLAAIKWFLEILLNGDTGKLSKQQQEIAENIDQSNNRMIDLVNSLLDISRIESGKITPELIPTDVKKLVEALLLELKNSAKEKQLKISFEITDSIKEVMIDPKLIRNVYMNLLTNAIKYTPSKGNVAIKIMIKKGMLFSEIADTGYGIPKKNQDKIFGKFYRADNITTKVPDGNGLGLYSVKKIIEACKGTIDFESKEDKGTTFWFELPLNIEKKK